MEKRKKRKERCKMEDERSAAPRPYSGVNTFAEEVGKDVSGGSRLLDFLSGIEPGPAD